MSTKHLDSSSDGEESEGEEETILFPKKKKQKEPVEEVSSEDERLLVASDSDEAPEDIGFSKGRKMALDNVKRTLEHIRNKKQEEKAKRRARDELYKQQKLEALRKSRLSDDFLKELTDELSPPKKVKSGLDALKQEDDSKLNHTEDLLGSDDDDDNGQFDEDCEESEDFIPLGLSGSHVEAVSLSDYIRHQPKSAAEKAAEFRNKLLYGNKVPRESTQNMMSKRTKRLARYK